MPSRKKTLWMLVVVVVGVVLAEKEWCRYPDNVPKPSDLENCVEVTNTLEKLTEQLSKNEDCPFGQRVSLAAEFIRLVKKHDATKRCPPLDIVKRMLGSSKIYSICGNNSNVCWEWAAQAFDRDRQESYNYTGQASNDPNDIEVCYELNAYGECMARSAVRDCEAGLTDEDMKVMDIRLALFGVISSGPQCSWGRSVYSTWIRSLKDTEEVKLQKLRSGCHGHYPVTALTSLLPLLLVAWGLTRALGR